MEDERVGMPALLFMYTKKHKAREWWKLAKGKNTVTAVAELALPVAESLGLLLWDVRFEKEGAQWYLRLFVDKDTEGGITIDDCEAMSRAMDPVLDEADPISQSYVLEVGSPGTERELVKDWHFERYMGQNVTVRLIRPRDGQRDFVGALAAKEGDTVRIRTKEGEESFPLSETAFVKLYDDYFMGGLD